MQLPKCTTKLALHPQLNIGVQRAEIRNIYVWMHIFTLYSPCWMLGKSDDLLQNYVYYNTKLYTYNFVGRMYSL